MPSIASARRRAIAIQAQSYGWQANQDRGVTAASSPVKRTVRVQIQASKRIRKMKMRGERLRRLAYPTSGFCSESNPSPGTKISTPEFGCELFVARPLFRSDGRAIQAQVIHRGLKVRFQHGIPIRLMVMRLSILKDGAAACADRSFRSACD